MPGSTDLIENSKKRKQEISPRYEGQQVREVYKDFLSWETSKLKKNGVRKVPEPGAPWCLVPTRVTFLAVPYFPNFLNIPKQTKNIFVDFSESV